MSNDNDEDRNHRRVFDVRQVNLTKLDKLVDLEIIIAEAEFAISGVKDQIATDYGDSRWRVDANRAIREIEHKLRLANLKRDAIVQARADATPPPEENFKARFMKAAQRLLEPATYEKLFEEARYKEPEAA